MSQLRGPDGSLSRRGLLTAFGGLAGVAGVTYVGAQSVHRGGKEGTINARFVIGERISDSDTVVGTTKILDVIGHSDSPPTRRIHPDYREAFPPDPPMTVSSSLHQTLQREFDDVRYALSQDCPAARCSTPQVSRQDFNSAEMGEEVTLAYDGSRATRVD